MHYEIHLTVEQGNIDTFKRDCEEISVKPILIETENKKVFGKQLMTSSKYTTPDYKPNLKALSNLLEKKNYKIVRQKVEIKPEQTKHEDFIYYESHVRLKLPKIFYDKELINSYTDWHLSKNLFKSDAEFDYQMLTYRNNEVSFRAFNRIINSFTNYLDLNKIEYDKIEIEECIFDSNISVDKDWI